jgi:DNA-binding SARP family transcriptional activator
MTHIRLRIVGDSVIEVGAEQITPAATLLFPVLLYLAVESGREVPRSELIERLYPSGDDASKTAHRLRQLLYNLRGIGAPIVFTARAVKVEADRVHIDANELSSGNWELRRDHLTHSFEILPRYSGPEGTAFGAWVEELREKLHNALRQQLTRDMEVARRKADWRYLEALARRTMELDPLNESAVLALAEATARTGSKARAISILDTYRAELGEERANLALPASLLQKRINATTEHVSRTPRDPIPLVGREREVEFLVSQWQCARRGSAHVVWVTGNKSVGKSRLVEEMAASEYAEFVLSGLTALGSKIEPDNLPRA